MRKRTITKEKRNSMNQLFMEAYGLFLDPYAEDEDFFSYDEVDEDDNNYNFVENRAQCG